METWQPGQLCWPIYFIFTRALKWKQEVSPECVPAGILHWKWAGRRRGGGSPSLHIYGCFGERRPSVSSTPPSSTPPPPLPPHPAPNGIALFAGPKCKWNRRKANEGRQIESTVFPSMRRNFASSIFQSLLLIFFPAFQHATRGQCWFNIPCVAEISHLC